jgi:hypothetical protein
VAAGSRESARDAVELEIAEIVLHGVFIADVPLQIPLPSLPRKRESIVVLHEVVIADFLFTYRGRHSRGSGNPLAIYTNMDPRLRGDDASVANRRDASRLALRRMRHFVF